MAATGPAGDGQISSEFESRLPAPQTLADFFLPRGHFWHEFATLARSTNFELKKTSMCRILTEMIHPRVGQRLSAADYLFSASSRPRLKVSRNSEGGSRRFAFWVRSEQWNVRLRPGTDIERAAALVPFDLRQHSGAP